jgi:hypothetical protein
MMSPDQLDRYRQMSQPERWREVELLMTYAWRALKQLPWLKAHSCVLR